MYPAVSLSKTSSTSALQAAGVATFSAEVTCLQVSGNTATIGGVVTAGYGYDDNFASQNDLTGDWFITTVQDNSHQPNGSPLDTMGLIDWGDRAYFASEGFNSFTSLCDNPAADIGTAQFPLNSGDIIISN